MDQDPRKRKLKLDVMALNKADRERLKALVKVSLIVVVILKMCSH